MMLTCGFAMNAAVQDEIGMVKVKKVSERRSTITEGLTAQDFVGVYTWDGKNGTNYDIGFGGELTITLDETRENGLILKNFPNYFTTFATFEPETGRIIIPNQCLETWYDTISASNGKPEQISKQEFWFQNYTAKNEIIDGQTKIKFAVNSETPFYFTLKEEGCLMSGGDIDMEKFSNYKYTDEELKELFCAAAVEIRDDTLTAETPYYLLYWIEAKKKISAVEAITENDNDSVSYYNLQGIKMDEPEKGQIVIVKKGGKVEKMIVR